MKNLRRYTQQIDMHLHTPLEEGYVYLRSQNQLTKLAVCFVPNATGQLINVGFSLIANKQGTSITAHNKTYFVGKPDIYTPTIQWIEP